MGLNQCMVKDLYNGDILSHLNPPQHMDVSLSVLLFCMATYFVKVSTEAVLPNGAKLTDCVRILGCHTK